jgi:UMP-CMP kinase
LLTLFFECPKEIARKQYPTRKLRGRETDDEAKFEKRHAEYMMETPRTYSSNIRNVSISVDTSRETDVSWDELMKKLREDARWTDLMS